MCKGGTSGRALGPPLGLEEEAALDLPCAKETAARLKLRLVICFKVLEPGVCDNISTLCQWIPFSS